MLLNPKTLEQAKEVLKAYTECESNTRILSDKCGTPSRTLRNWVKKAKELLGNKDASLKARKTLETETVTAVYFTDAHNQPKHDFYRFKLLASFVNDINPDYLIDGGDFDDFESLCSHVRNDTNKAKKKTPFYDDFQYSIKAHEYLDSLITVDCKKHRTLGNHEHRMWLYEDRFPETYNTIVPPYLDLCEKYGWELTEYGGFLDIHGVDFTHMPFNGMGKPMGGKQPHVTMANSLMRDICFGHTHGYGLHTAHKLGDQRHVRVLNGGCFMYNNYMPSYAKNSQKSFWYGAHKVIIKNGKMDVISYHMDELEKLYGND